MTQLDGRCEIPHMNDMWNATWDTRQLLNHVVALFKEPDLSLLPEPMVFAAKAWSWSREDERRVVKKAEDAEKKAEEDAEEDRMKNAMGALRGISNDNGGDDKKGTQASNIDTKDTKDNNIVDTSNITKNELKDEPKDTKDTSDVKGDNKTTNGDNKNDDDIDEKSVHTFASNAESEEWNDDEGIVDTLLGNVEVAEEKLPSARSNASNKQEKGGNDDTKGDEKKEVEGDALANDNKAIIEEEEDEHDRDSSLYLGAGDLEGIISKFSRQEQMHVNVIALYVDSLKTYCGDGPKDKYFEVVKLYMEKYAHEYEEPKEPEPQPVIEEVKEEYTGFWDDDDDEDNDNSDSDDGLGTQDYNNDSSTLYGGDGPITQMFAPSIDSVPRDIGVYIEVSQISAVSQE